MNKELLNCILHLGILFGERVEQKLFSPHTFVDYSVTGSHARGSSQPSLKRGLFPVQTMIGATSHKRGIAPSWQQFPDLPIRGEAYIGILKLIFHYKGKRIVTLRG